MRHEDCLDSPDIENNCRYPQAWLAGLFVLPQHLQSDGKQVIEYDKGMIVSWKLIDVLLSGGQTSQNKD